MSGNRRPDALDENLRRVLSTRADSLNPQLSGESIRRHAEDEPRTLRTSVALPLAAAAAVIGIFAVPLLIITAINQGPGPSTSPGNPLNSGSRPSPVPTTSLPSVQPTQPLSARPTPSRSTGPVAPTPLPSTAARGPVQQITPVASGSR
jgi:hypothetical protein